LIESRTARNGDIELHYKAAGSGPPIVFLHGFPDHSLGWRRQIEALSGRYRVLAPDLRGFGKSSAPGGVAHYSLPHLVNDALAILEAEGLSQAAIVGHDWGATIAWWLAIRAPKTVRHLVILSTPHPRQYLRAIADPANARTIRYIRQFQNRNAASTIDLDELTEWVSDPQDRFVLRETLQASNLEAMLNYYRANIPLGHVPELGPLPLVKSPTLVLFGTADPYVPDSAYDGVFREVDNVTSLVSIPGAGHFIHHDDAAFVTDQIDAWVSRPPSAYRKSINAPRESTSDV
jgi:pimeloyl-ACP methyl ester carboxylesterase